MADTQYLKDNLKGFVPRPIANDIIELTTRGSSILRLCNVQAMESDNKTFPVMTDGVGAYWVGETERIQTSKAQWIFPEIVAKKIAVIIPVTKEKMEDTTIDVFGEVKPTIAEAFYKSIDAACFFGIDSPFAKSIYGVAHAAGREIAVGTNLRADGNAALDLDISDVMALVEEAGFDVNGFAASLTLKNSLRKLRDANGNQLYVKDVTQDILYSQPIEFNRTTAWDLTKAIAIAGDWKYAIVGIREEIKYEILDQATLFTVTMADGQPLSLAENDMIGLKATMRLGFLPVKEDAFALLVPKASSGGNGTVESGTVSGGTVSGGN